MTAAADSTERDTFLIAIRADPTSDGPRLEYADWLDGVGEYDRAEFIRVQCRIAQLDAELMSREECDDPDCSWCVERRGLRRREDDLLRDNIRQWTDDRIQRWQLVGADDGRFPDLVTGVVRRGFVAQVRGPLAAFWWERECDTCRRLAPGEPAPVNSYRRRLFTSHPECPECHGTGRVSGPTPALVELARREPVGRVEVTDREPAASDMHPGMWRWFVGESGRAEIPSAVYDRLVGKYPESRHGRATQPYWWSRVDANAALSAAFLAAARDTSIAIVRRM